MVHRGEIEDECHVVIFQMLPEAGDLSQPNNWRPIDILPVLYKIFSRMLYGRIALHLDSRQCTDQIDFRPHCCIEGAFATLEALAGKHNESNLDLWVASLDMKKAFDRKEHRPLIESLRSDGLAEGYIHLLTALYANQIGCVRDG